MNAPSPQPEATRPTIPVRYLIELLERSRPRAATIRRAFVAASIPRDALRSPRMRLSVAQFERLHAVITREKGDEAFGFFERPVPVGAYATLLRLLVGSVDLSSALDGAGSFYRLFDRHRYWQVVIEGGTARLELQPRDAEQARSIFFVHTMLLAPWRTLSWLAARPLPLDMIRLSPAFRRFRGETQFLFGCEPKLSRGAPAIALKAELLRLPVARTRAEADERSKTSLRNLLLAPAPATIQAELRALLSAAKPVAALSISEAARELHMSRASLARKLAERGLAFQRIKDDLRRDHAIGLLTGTSLSIADIADRLGYSAASAFQRAFREWTGVSPGYVRKSFT